MNLLFRHDWSRCKITWRRRFQNMTWIEVLRSRSLRELSLSSWFWYNLFLSDSLFRLRNNYLLFFVCLKWYWPFLFFLLFYAAINLFFSFTIACIITIVIFLIWFLYSFSWRFYLLIVIFCIVIHKLGKRFKLGDFLHFFFELKVFLIRHISNITIINFISFIKIT